MFDVDKTAVRIREKRVERNLTQQQLADAMDVSYQAVSNWERGTSMPDISKLGDLAGILQCSVDELLGLEQKSCTEIHNHPMEEMQQQNVESIDELCGIAPFLRREIVDQLAKRIR